MFSFHVNEKGYSTRCESWSEFLLYITCPHCNKRQFSPRSVVPVPVLLISFLVFSLFSCYRSQFVVFLLVACVDIGHPHEADLSWGVGFGVDCSTYLGYISVWFLIHHIRGCSAIIFHAVRVDRTMVLGRVGRFYGETTIWGRTLFLSI